MHGADRLRVGFRLPDGQPAPRQESTERFIAPRPEDLVNVLATLGLDLRPLLGNEPPPVVGSLVEPAIGRYKVTQSRITFPPDGQVGSTVELVWTPFIEGYAELIADLRFACEPNAVEVEVRSTPFSVPFGNVTQSSEVGKVYITPEMQRDVAQSTMFWPTIPPNGSATFRFRNRTVYYVEFSVTAVEIAIAPDEFEALNRIRTAWSGRRGATR